MACRLSSAPRISARAFFAAGCAEFGSAARVFAVLWNQHRWSRVSGTPPAWRPRTRAPRRQRRARGPDVDVDAVGPQVHVVHIGDDSATEHGAKRRRPLAFLVPFRGRYFEVRYRDQGLRWA